MKAPLPIVDGVGPSSHWLPVGPWETILDFLHERFPGVETATWIARMSKGQVMDETGLPLNPGTPYRVGACVFYYREVESESRIPFDERVLYEDEHILVVDKPHFLPVIPAGRFLHETLLVRLRKQGKPDALVPIHRLDRETAGVIMFSLNPKTRGHYTSLFRNRRVKKVYEALARPANLPSNLSSGLPKLSFPVTRRSRITAGRPFFRMMEVEGEPNSETYIDVLKQAAPLSTGEHPGMGAEMKGATLYQLIPVTGRKHQLRLHLSGLGIPIVNDRLYPHIRADMKPDIQPDMKVASEFPTPFDSEDDFSNPLKLLAKSISFKDPFNGRERYFESGRKL